MNTPYSSRKCLNRKRAFTLIEILVVIAIIGILAAILFPVFGQARERARMSSCLSNMKQIGNAMLMYLQDYDEKYHDANDGPNGVTAERPEQAANGFGKHVDPKTLLNPWTHWAWFYGPYVKSVGVFDCPSSPDGTDHYTVDEWDADGNYGYNYDGLSRDVGKPSRSLAELERPAEVFAIFDSGDSSVCPGANTWANVLGDLDLDRASGKEAAIRHQGRANMLFADGHVKSILPVQLLTRNQDNSIPWMMDWDDCSPVCSDPPFDASSFE